MPVSHPCPVVFFKASPLFLGGTHTAVAFLDPALRLIFSLPLADIILCFFSRLFSQQLLAPCIIQNDSIWRGGGLSGPACPLPRHAAQSPAAATRADTLRPPIYTESPPLGATCYLLLSKWSGVREQAALHTMTIDHTHGDNWRYFAYKIMAQK